MSVAQALIALLSSEPGAATALDPPVALYAPDNAEAVVLAQSQASPPTPAPAAPPPLSDIPRFPSDEALAADMENDNFAVLPKSQRTDRFYTHGSHFNMMLATEPPAWLLRAGLALRAPFLSLLEQRPTCAAGDAGCTDEVNYAWGWGFGQNIYTSENIDDDAPRDRPYAGLAYGSVSLVSISASQLNTLELQAGLVGPSAQAWFSQDEMHRRLPTDLARGWPFQIRDEPGGSLQWERRWRVRQARLGRFAFDRTDFVGAEVGTFRTNFSGGMLFRAGFNLERDFGPPRSWPAPATASLLAKENGGEVYVFGGVDLRVIGREITLDGNTFRDSSRADKLFLVPEFVAGVGLRIGVIRGHYMHVLRFPEFDGQIEDQQFGRLSISYVKGF